MPGSASTACSSSVRESRKTSLAVAPTSPEEPFAPCGCSACWSWSQFCRIGRGSIAEESPAGRIAKCSEPVWELALLTVAPPSVTPWETTEPTRSGPMPFG